jgi:hypothetical protein
MLEVTMIRCSYHFRYGIDGFCNLMNIFLTTKIILSAFNYKYSEDESNERVDKVGDKKDRNKDDGSNSDRDTKSESQVSDDKKDDNEIVEIESDEDTKVVEVENDDTKDKDAKRIFYSWVSIIYCTIFLLLQLAHVGCTIWIMVFISSGFNIRVTLVFIQFAEISWISLMGCYFVLKQDKEEEEENKRMWEQGMQPQEGLAKVKSRPYPLHVFEFKSRKPFMRLSHWKQDVEGLVIRPATIEWRPKFNAQTKRSLKL